MTQIAIKKSGNSVTVRIPSPILKALSLQVDDPINIELDDGRIVLTPVTEQEPVSELPQEDGDKLLRAVCRKMGWTQKNAADYFGITLRAWEKKEQGVRNLSTAETHFYKLLAGLHSEYMLIRRNQGGSSPVKHAADCAGELAAYLSGHLALPSEANSLLEQLNHAMANFNGDWEADIKNAVGNAIPDEVTVLKMKIAELEQQLAAK